MAQKNLLKIFVILLALSVDSNRGQVSNKSTDFRLSEAHMRYARFRCLQQFPQAEIVNYSDTSETHCFLHCFLYKSGLMDLKTRGLDSEKFMEIWQKIEFFDQGKCLNQFDFSEPLSGMCSNSYRKLMEFRSNCLKLFEHTFSPVNVWKKEDTKYSKRVGVTATEFCDSIHEEEIAAKENLQNAEVTILTQYKEKLQCIFENIHYLDAYGRVDESEINLSYQEAHEDSPETRDIVRQCSHRANSKFQEGFLGNLVVELLKCLSDHSPVFKNVFQRRDENSRHY